MMLKLTYTEDNLHLEYLGEPLEEWIAARVVFNLRLGRGITVQPSCAAFLVPVGLPLVRHLQAQVARQQDPDIGVCLGDRDYLEISLRGTWISHETNNSLDTVDQGVFVTSLPYGVEFLLLKVWQEQGTEVVRS
jgi:hypothetical protein